LKVGDLDRVIEDLASKYMADKKVKDVDQAKAEVKAKLATAKPPGGAATEDVDCKDGPCRIDRKPK
jgi:hypothetical protein